MNQSQMPYSISHPVTVQGPDGYFYTFYNKRNTSRAGDLNDLWSPFYSTGSDVVIPRMATPPCWFKKARNIYDYSASGYPSTSLMIKPNFGCMVYVKHSSKDCYHSPYWTGDTMYHSNFTYYLPRVSNMDFEQETHSFTPLYEAINPSVTKIDGTNVALMTFWTMVAPQGLKFESTSSNSYWYLDLDKSNICYYDIWTDTYRNVFNGAVVAREELSSVLCSAVIEWREVKQLKTMWEPSEQKALIPLVTRVTVLDFNNGPKLDISAGGGSEMYYGPFKLSLNVTEESNAGTASTVMKIHCTGGYCRVNGKLFSVSAMEKPITNYNANSTYEIWLHYNQVLSDSGSVSSHTFELLMTSSYYANTATDSYCHLGRLSKGTAVEQYFRGCPDLFTFQTDC
ncbi:MAG: hypothetical protein J6Y62_02030 [Clostridia bacterium]|nr:hypothetical protein [Clostridia bacterium]